MSIEKRVVVIGTCRVTRSVNRMHRPGITAQKVYHRFHTAKQLIQGLRYHAGEDVIPRELAHTISRLSIETLASEPEPFEALETYRTAVAPIREADAFIIEVSVAKDHFATTDAHGEVLINSMVSADIAKYQQQFAPLYADGTLAELRDFRTEASDGDQVRQQMRQIKNYLQKPILWVTYANPVEPLPGEEALHRMRARMAQWVERAAKSMADKFYDPTDLVRQNGRAWLFADEGRDLQHYTHEAQAALGPILIDRLGIAP